MLRGEDFIFVVFGPGIYLERAHVVSVDMRREGFRTFQ